VPEPHAFPPPPSAVSANGRATKEIDEDALVRTITDRVLEALAAAGV
jgi:hypothetical protein